MSVDDSVQLIPSKPEYFTLWIRWRGEPNTRRYNPIKDESEAGLRERFLKAGISLADLKSAEEFRFFVSWQGKIIGNVSLKNISHMMMYGEIGFGLAQDYQGKGLGTRVVRQFVEKIFLETGLRRLIAYVAEDNISSCHVLEKIGFQREGLCRQHYIINDVPTNEILYGLLRSDLEEQGG